MSTLPKTEELAALRFATLEGYRACVSVYTENRPKGYFATAGNYTAIFPKADEDWLKETLKEYKLDSVQIVSISDPDLSSGYAAQIRRQRGLRDNPDKRARLQQLRDRRARRQG